MENGKWNGLKIYLPLVLAGLMLVGCVAPYKAPKENEPHALLKLQYKYTEVSPGKTMKVAMAIMEGKDENFRSGFNQNIGFVRNATFFTEVPINTVRVRPGMNTVLRMGLAFWWTTSSTSYQCSSDSKGRQTCRNVTTTIYHEVGCYANTQFDPELNKIYLVDFNSLRVQKDCTATVFEQTPTADKQFQLQAVSREYTPKKK